MDFFTILRAFKKAKRYTDSVALYGVPVKTPQIDAATRRWLVFNPAGNNYIDTGIVAEGKDGVTPRIGENGNWFIGDTDTGARAIAREVELTADSANIKWRYAGQTEWQNIVALSTLHGKDGAIPELRMNGNVLQWKYQADTEWNDLFTFPDFDKFLQKVDTPSEDSPYRLYAIDALGKQATLKVVTMPVEGSIPAYSSKKTLKT